jgi:hypothetical protein
VSCSLIPDGGGTPSSTRPVNRTHHVVVRHGLCRVSWYNVNMGSKLIKLSCAWLSVGTYYSTNLTVTWRLPLALACVGPLALLAGLPFVPGKISLPFYSTFLITSIAESPRYLVWCGKNETAWAVISKLHHDPSDPLEDAARAEFTQIVQQVEFDKKEDSGFIQMFKRPSWRHRTLSAMFIMWVTLNDF